MTKIFILIIICWTNLTFAQIEIDIHIVDDYYYKNTEQGYTWTTFQIIEDNKVILSDEHFLMYICPVGKDTTYVNNNELTSDFNKDALFLTNFTGNCRRGLSFRLGNLKLEKKYSLRFITNWQDAANYNIDLTKCSILIDIRNFYKDYFTNITDTPEKQIKNGDTLYIQRSIYGCFDEDRKCLKIYKEKDVYIAEMEKNKYKLSEPLFLQALAMREAIEDLRQSPYTSADVNTDYVYFFKIGNFLISQEDNTGGNWEKFDELLSEIIK